VLCQIYFDLQLYFCLDTYPFYIENN
jgi:hypothetical protein